MLEDKIEEAKKQKTPKLKTKSGPLEDGSSHPGPGQLHPHFLTRN